MKCNHTSKYHTDLPVQPVGSEVMVQIGQSKDPSIWTPAIIPDWRDEHCYYSKTYKIKVKDGHILNGNRRYDITFLAKAEAFVSKVIA